MRYWGIVPAGAGALAVSLFVWACSPAATSDVPDAGGGDNSALSTLNSILFVTQVPLPDDFTTIVSTFGNHLPDPGSCPRGGDLWIRYPTGRLKNLTDAAGYGNSGLQGADSIAVREPCVHWNGNQAVFSMIVGAPAQFQNTSSKWQLYEVVGLHTGDMPVITKVANQPTGWNNTAPCYASDGRILFTSDRPRNGAAHLYPQLDEYEEQPTNTGIWSLDPQTGELALLNHAPSGAFSPRVDSFGRVVFTRWDHLERDQQADDDHITPQFGTFNYSSEAADSVPTSSSMEVFPEPSKHWIDYVNDHPNYSGELYGYAPYLNGNTLNHFFPWQMNQDGTQEETLNHIGRHELHHYFNASRNDDPNLISFLGVTQYTANSHPIDNMLQIREDPSEPGTYYGIDAPEFFTHAAGQVIRLHGPPGMKADDMTVDYVTSRDTSNFDDTPSSAHSGLYRNPLPLSNGKVVVVHTKETNKDANIGTGTSPRSRYDFRIKLLERNGTYSIATRPLTPGIRKSVQFYSPNSLLTYDGELWELDPVEVVVRPVPASPQPVLPAPERRVLSEEGVTIPQLVAYLKSRDLALVVSRNVTARDRNDRQQPFNLRVAGSNMQTLGAGGKVYDVSHMQFFQGDQLRGLTFGQQNIAPGRRVIAQVMHEPGLDNPPVTTGPDGSVEIAPDGSMAALVPTKRALSWQLTDPQGTGIVRERYWLTFQPGEIRSCVSCHGLSSADQANRPESSNRPEALRRLLRHLKASGSL